MLQFRSRNLLVSFLSSSMAESPRTAQQIVPQPPAPPPSQQLVHNNHANSDAAPIAPSVAGSSPSSSSFLPGALRGNPYFTAGAGVAGLAAGMTILRRSVLSGLLLAEKHFTVSLEIASKDAAYGWVLKYLSRPQGAPTAAQGGSGAAAGAKMRRLAGPSRQQHLGLQTLYQQHSNGSVQTTFDFVPSPGNHWLWHNGRLLYCKREREKAMVDLQSGSPWETVTLQCLGRDPRVFTDLLTAARTYALQKTEGHTIIYTSTGMEWRPFGQPRRKRPLHSVVLDAGVAERLEADLHSYIDGRAWYTERGIPYRRGYLLHGPPGSGKRLHNDSYAAFHCVARSSHSLPFCRVYIAHLSCAFAAVYSV